VLTYTRVGATVDYASAKSQYIFQLSGIRLTSLAMLVASTDDIQRLEEQASWSKEPDFFADMEPSIMKHTGVDSQRSPVGSSAQRSSAGNNSPRSPASSNSQLTSMKYQPTEQEEVRWYYTLQV